MYREIYITVNTIETKYHYTKGNTRSVFACLYSIHDDMRLTISKYHLRVKLFVASDNAMPLRPVVLVLWYYCTVC